MTAPKLMFLCGCLEPGKSGVGDYSRGLAGSLWRGWGIRSTLVSLRDPYIKGSVESGLEDEPEGVRLHRMPEESRVPQWVEALNGMIAADPPDWISLQYVGYAFDRFGSAAPLRSLFKGLHRPSDCRLQVMFHELWEGFGRDASLGVRLRGAYQRWQLCRFLRRFPPDLAHTQTSYYQGYLRRIGQNAELRPLPGNIAMAPSDGALACAQIAAASGVDIQPANRKDYLVGALFGSIYPGWPLERCVEAVVESATRCGRTPVLLAIGQSHSGTHEWERLKQVARDRIQFGSFGFLEAPLISVLFQEIDFGLSSTPFEAVGKSGAFAAMRDHGLPVFAGPGCLRMPGSMTMLESESGCFPIDTTMADTLSSLSRSTPRGNALDVLARQWVSDMNLISSPPSTP